VDHRTDFLSHKMAFKTELPHLIGGGGDQTCGWRVTQLSAGETIALITLYDLAKLPHLTISIKLLDRKTKHYSQPSHLWDHIRASAYMPIPGLDAGGITPELKVRLKFYCSWTWCFLIFFLFLFVCLFYYCGVFIFIFIPIFFLYYLLHHHYILIPTLTSFTLPHSPVL
jgi:hypothetical protein